MATKKGNVTEVRSMMEEAGLDLEKELSSADDARLGYPTPKLNGDLSSFVYVDQISELIKWQTLNPELHGHTYLFLGSSAIGKTYAIRQGLLEAAKLQGRPLELHEVHVSQMGPTDVMGVPRDDGTGRTVWFPPRMFPLVQALPAHQQAYTELLDNYQATGTMDWSIMTGTRQYALFLDEITNPSNPSIVHQCFPIIYGKQVADHPLVGDTIVIAAGNRVQDRTNSIYLAASATSRMSLIEAVPRLSGWFQKWAMQPVEIAGELFTREHPLVIAYLHRFPDRFAPDSSDKPQMEPFPSPRTWSYVSQLLYAHDRNPIADGTLFAAVAGRVGTSDARLFWAFREHWRDLPDVNKLLNSKEVKDGFGWLPTPWPNRPDLLIIMGTQMVGKLTKANAPRFMRFMLDKQKFPPEIAAMTMKLLRPSGKLEPLAHTWARPQFGEWAQLYRNLLF